MQLLTLANGSGAVNNKICYVEFAVKSGSQMQLDGDFEYGEGGNSPCITEDNHYEYKWDAFYRLTKVTDKAYWDDPANTAPQWAEYRYDGLGRRIACLYRVPAGNSTNWDSYITVYDGVLPIEERVFKPGDARHGDLLRRFYYEQGNRPALVEEFPDGPSYPPAVYIPLLDDRGTVMGVADSTGTVIEKLYYNTTGLCKSFDGSGIENLRAGTSYNLGRSKYIDFGYLGMTRDRFTGKYHTHFRDYDPVHGRWFSEDPAGYADGLNLFHAYMDVNGTDPLGLYDPSSPYSCGSYNACRRNGVSYNPYRQTEAFLTSVDEKAMEEARSLIVRTIQAPRQMVMAPIDCWNNFETNYSDIDDFLINRGVGGYILGKTNGIQGADLAYLTASTFLAESTPLGTIAGGLDRERLVFDGPEIIGVDKMSPAEGNVNVLLGSAESLATYYGLKAGYKQSREFLTNPTKGAEVVPVRELGQTGASGTVHIGERVENIAQRAFDYAVDNPRVSDLSRIQLGKDAEIQASRWLRRWAEHNEVPLGPGGLRFQVRGSRSIPDVVFDPTKQVFDFKLAPTSIRPAQTQNILNDFPGYDLRYIYGPDLQW